VQQAYADLLHRLPPDPVRRATAHGLRWQLEELRISLFAQELGTRAPVSEQRVLREIEGLGSSS
jgi:ATP-dependent helicase HrpA